MRSFTLLAFLLYVAVLFCAAGAAAQDTAGAPSLAPPSVFGSQGAAPSGFATTPWQFSIGSQYNRIAVPNVIAPFNTYGARGSLTRYFGAFLGVEAEVGAGVGRAAPGPLAYAVFAGLGPRFVYRTKRFRFEPWGHGLAGVEHFNFGAAPFPARTTSVAWVMGGGVDYRFNTGFALRLQADYLGTLLAGVYQRNTQLAGGFVWNF